ncbi:aromatic ring-hydroxylating oxygenase subunit alpha [Roseovarius sp. 2305UL8-3]|uniref:aromatic ring-hydroxylating oxygenase subunit alpha n=1 Tax=Roseovarius conchicola TaxID=3121636 RepID=UPI003526E159
MPSRPAELDTLLAEHREGLALPRGFYTSQEIYDHDIATYWNKNWIWVGHVSQIPNPGDYFLFDYANESIIVVRDRDGDIHAHLNVCRHRGSRICTEQSGNARTLVCPYHAWTFELTGKLRAGRAMGPDFNPADWGLFPAQLRVFQGLIFVCASQDAPPIDDGLAELAPLMAPFGTERMKIAHTANYPVPANWKLALENYMECYHCAPAHLEYARSHTLKMPKDVETMTPALIERSRKIGLPGEEFHQSGVDTGAPGADFYYRRYPLYDGYETGSKSGAPLAPPLGELTGCDGGATDFQMGMLNNILFYADHAVGYRFVPRGLQETDIQVVWMVREDAEEGTDYDLDDLTWLWHVTSLDDERIIRLNQQGVNSQFFQPGPLAEMEWSIRSFYDGYLAMITR